MKYEKRRCVVCNQWYEPKTYNQKTCSQVCRNIRRKEQRKKYNKDKAEHLQTYRKDYYQKNKDKMKSTTAKWYQSHKEERREYARQYRRDNVEYFKQYRSERRQKDIDKVFDSYYNYLQNQTW
jgi:predicted nucleic acid-binding Zn ribbon protein